MRINSTLVKEAVKDERWAELYELMDIEAKAEHREWVKGYLVGGISVLSGFAVVRLAAKYIK